MSNGTADPGSLPDAHCPCSADSNKDRRSCIFQVTEPPLTCQFDDDLIFFLLLHDYLVLVDRSVPMDIAGHS